MPYNIAGQASLISRAQRKLGFVSDVLILERNAFNFEHDYNIGYNMYPKVIVWLRRLYYFLFCFIKYDIFHFHFGETLLPKKIDLFILKLFRKKLIMEFWGSDIRIPEIATKYSLIPPHFFKTRKASQEIKQNLDILKKYVNTFIVGDYSLLPYAPKGTLAIKQLFDIENISYSGVDKENKKPLIIHAPTNREVKGTSHVLSSIERLRKEGYEFEFLLLEKVPHLKLMKICNKADIIVDELLSESYGILAIECMAMGKPVITRIDPAFRKYYQEMPLIDSNPEKIYSDIRFLIENPNKRYELGLKSRDFVEKIHNSPRIALQLLKIYNN
ncbi:MAG: glycosyltransferase [Candidatus Hodarchaeales archaeon]